MEAAIAACPSLRFEPFKRNPFQTEGGLHCPDEGLFLYFDAQEQLCFVETGGPLDFCWRDVRFLRDGFAALRQSLEEHGHRLVDADGFKVPSLGISGTVGDSDAVASIGVYVRGYYD